ncbi:hypothetical protein FE257_010560 [Aspergillus nanangensis]|uniref:Uncharacterized protein n=1 Tax=Aspergillus nanangensis TaxID=2582783 RepID=A0AAD4GRZ6_ASPNN|nr:hypothetical protein FE257_010560 [Aspergillus nanangensis]
MRGGYSPVDTNEGSENESDGQKMPRTGQYWLSVWSLFNVLWSGILLFTALSLAQSSIKLRPPYSPVREAGVERFINTRYRPGSIFQSPPSEEAKQFGLPESVKAYLDPGNRIYVLGVYHQMHCLSRVRKSLYPQRYYPNESQHEVEHHVHHCLNVLRETILCHGDVSLAYWWRQDYSYTDESGRRQYTPEYLQRTAKQQANDAFIKWDSQLQCRDMEPINAWMKEHKMDPDKYGGQQVD